MTRDADGRNLAAMGDDSLTDVTPAELLGRAVGIHAAQQEGTPIPSAEGGQADRAVPLPPLTPAPARPRTPRRRNKK